MGEVPLCESWTRAYNQHLKKAAARLEWHSLTPQLTRHQLPQSHTGLGYLADEIQGF